MKTIFVIGDGMADRPIRELEGKTPLEATETPNLDKVASKGVCGIMDIISPGQPPGSDIANLTLLGHDPLQSYRGRGALEALGAGLDMGQGDVAFRGNFAHVDDGEVVVDRRAGRIDGSVFREYLSDVSLRENSDIDVTVRPTLEHRLAIVLRGRRLSWRISDVDPHKVGAKVLRSMPLEETAEAKRTANIANELYRVLREMMQEHPLNNERKALGLPPVNAIILRGAGEPPAITPLTELYGIRGSCITATPTVAGACLSSGLELLDVLGATGGVDTDTHAKARAALEALPDFDLVFLHVKGTDVASHDGDFEQKIRVIEKIDAMVGSLLDRVDPESTYIAVTADHTTSIRMRDHTGDPVPVAILGPETGSDDVESYSERACAIGSLGRIHGKDLMPILMNYMGRVKLIGS
jgi:2,3-bisphosphoglycerate-independent phosphoglycerate mutase